MLRTFDGLVERQTKEQSKDQELISKHNKNWDMEMISAQITKFGFSVDATGNNWTDTGQT